MSGAMKISVLIPTYNSSRTIGETLDSVLRQTLIPHEVLVFDDGSTDDTLSILNIYKHKITVIQGRHGGVANARNQLCERASGDLIAFLDSDDVWHPDYLTHQKMLFNANPQAVAFFTGHIDFLGYSEIDFSNIKYDKDFQYEIMKTEDFFVRYNQGSGPFASMSYCCFPRKVLGEVGNEPFNPCLRGAEDPYFFYLLSLLKGSIVYSPTPLVAYRVLNGSLSDNRLEMLRYHVKAFELQRDRFKELADKELLAAYKSAFSMKRRYYAKILMGNGKVNEARRQLLLSLGNTMNFISIIKSLTLLLSTYAPRKIQPKWQSSYRS